MDNRRRGIGCHEQLQPRWLVWLAAPLLIAMALVLPCRADATLQVSTSGNGRLSASAHVDFRITVLPSLGLSAQAGGLRVQGNSGVMTLQRGPREAGKAPTTRTQLQPKRQVVDTELLAAGSELVTIASP